MYRVEQIGSDRGFEPILATLILDLFLFFASEKSSYVRYGNHTRTLNLIRAEKYSNEVRISECVKLGSMVVVSGRQIIHRMTLI